MQQQKTATLATIFSEILADLAFMFSEEDDTHLLPGDEWLETSINYKGTVSGTLRFWCSRSFSVILASNLLGIDPEDEDASSQARDAAKEFMNIICGQFVTAVHGTDSVYELSIPQIEELSETPGCSTTQDSEVAAFIVDGEQIRLSHMPH